MQSFLSFSQLSALSIALVGVLAVPVSADAQDFQNIDTAPNDRFSDRVTIEPGVSRLFGQLEQPDLSDFAYQTTEVLSPGEVDTFTISDLPPSQQLVVFLDTSDTQLGAVLGLFDNGDNLVDLGYNSYSYGSPYPSLTSAVPANGTIHLKVSGSGDDNFDGTNEYYNYYDYCGGLEACEPFAVAPHDQAGEYTVSVFVGDQPLRGDVDFFTLSGLTPGHVFSVAESTLSEFGLRIGWLANDGTLIGKSSYSEIIGREQLGGIVPASGEVHLVVSGYEDIAFEGRHYISQDYLLQVETRATNAP